MQENKKFIFYSLGIYAVYSIALFILGYFKIGLLSDDYLNFFDALHSTFYDKITGHQPYANVFHIRPIFYLSLEKSILVHDWLGFASDNFIFYRIQSLVMLLIISFIAGKIILHLTKKMTLALVGLATILIFPNNINNICWVTARVDLICSLFYLMTIYIFLLYSQNKNIILFAFTVLCCSLALLTKEIAITLPFTILFLGYFINGKEGLLRVKNLCISLFAVLIIYFIYRFFILGNNISEIATLYQHSPLSNAPGVLARGLISLTIPLDYLALNYFLRNDNKIIFLYLLSLYGAGFYLIWVMEKINTFKFAGQLLALILLMLLPSAIVGYMRPQMILLPFIIIMIYVLWIYNHQRNFNLRLNRKVLRAFYGVTIVFWGYWSAVVIQDWLTSYEKAKVNVENLLKLNIEHDKQTIIIGNPGRFKQTFMYDKMTGAYNFWKDRKFVINDTINDAIQTGAVVESSIGAKLDYKMTGANEFEIKTSAPKHFFYIEGYDNERIKTGFQNKDISVEFLEFNNINKPIRMKLKIFSNNVNCYLADNLNFIKIH